MTQVQGDSSGESHCFLLTWLRQESLDSAAAAEYMSCQPGFQGAGA